MCKGKDALQNHILEPYVIPRIRSVRSDPRVRFVENRVLFSAYNQVARPTYENVALPFYKDTLVPFYDHTLHPRLRPYTQKAHVKMIHLRRVAKPYAKRMWAFYDSAVPYAQQGWENVKMTYLFLEPRIIDAFHTALPYIEDFYTRAVVILDGAKQRAVGLRHIYVDPHVEKIWKTVIEGQANTEGKQ